MAHWAQRLPRCNLLMAIFIAAAILLGMTSATSAADTTPDPAPLEWGVEEADPVIILEPAADRPRPTGLARVAGRFPSDLLYHRAAR